MHYVEKSTVTFTRDEVPVWRTNKYVIQPACAPAHSTTAPSRVMGATSTTSVRRKKPEGVELLFNGQPYAKRRFLLTAPGLAFSNLPASYTTRYYGGATCESTHRMGKESGKIIYAVGISGYAQNFDPFYEGAYKSYWTSDSLYYMANRSLQGLSDNDLRSLLLDQKLDALTNAMELKKTGQMLRDLGSPLLRDTRSYVKDLKNYLRKERRRFRGEAALGIPGVRLTKTLADLHLAYVFGVKPLVGEMVGAFKLLTSTSLPIVKVRKFTKTPYRIVATGSLPISNAPGEQVIPKEWTTTHDGEVKFVYHLYGELDPLSDWRSYARLGINPLATAWELVPWSFAIDRFIDIGGALQSMGALKGFKRYKCYETRIHSQRSTKSFSFSNTIQSSQRKETTRVIRNLTWHLPTPELNWGANQVVTYTALLRQQLSKWTTILR